jgi:hypothetical protein
MLKFRDRVLKLRKQLQWKDKQNIPSQTSFMIYNSQYLPNVLYVNTHDLQLLATRSKALTNGHVIPLLKILHNQNLTRY